MNEQPTVEIDVRDWIAVVAMQGQLAGDDVWDLSNENHISAIAKRAYRMADAMLAERDSIPALVNPLTGGIHEEKR